MRAFLAAAFAALTVVGGNAPSASAADWRDSILGASSYREPIGGVAQERRAPAARAAARTASSQKQTETSLRPTQVASVDSNDEAPQRKGRRSQPQSSSSLSGGEQGVASYYWQPQRVASGGWFNPNAYTAAHKTLPFGTRVRVTRADNGNSVEVTINDRGPYIAGRIIDLSKRAAESIGMTGQGVARVRVSVLGRG